jgi:hypothetical protein
MPMDGVAVSITASPLQIAPSLFAVPEVSKKVIAGEMEFTDTEAEADAKHPLEEFVTVTLYEVVAVGETTLLFPVALMGAAHEKAIPLVGFATRVTLSPEQIIPSSFVVPDVSVKAIAAVGSVFTVTEAETDAAQAVLEFVTVTS